MSSGTCTHFQISIKLSVPLLIHGVVRMCFIINLKINYMSESKILKTEELEQGKIYYLDYGNNTQIIGRYKNSDVCEHFFYDLLHYWNGYETFRKGNQYCVKSGIENLRRASKAEIHNLVKFEIENDCL